MNIKYSDILSKIGNAKLLGISKKQSISQMKKAFVLGLRDFGENYLQELEEKQKALVDLKINWHFVGPLQSKKIKNLVGRVCLIHTVCRLKEVEEISKCAQKLKITQNILLQINVASEASKNGVLPEAAADFIKDTNSLEGINWCGLMAMPPLQEAEDNRKYFQDLKKLKEKIKTEYNLNNFNELSMGTTNDYLVAVQEGATLVRIGEALFGKREY